MIRPRAYRRSSRRLAALLVLGCGLVLSAGCARGEETAPPSSPDEPEAVIADEGVDETGESRAAPPDPSQKVPIEQLAGELVMTKLVGPAPTSDELDAIRNLHVGGIILFGPNVVDEPQLRALVDALDDARAPAARAAGLPAGVLVSVDQEGGPIRNVSFAPPERTQPQLAAGTIEAARAEAVLAGRALRRAGVGVDLGPVADLAQGPRRTMAFRSFGSDPQAAGRFVGATVSGLQDGGVAAVAKHFPGFGAATANSDDAVAYVDRTREQLLAEELTPFRAAIEAGVESIMVSHGIHRELGSTLPGTLDPRIATGLLRDELGFTGVAMTDSMNARGLREAWGDTVPRACPVAIGAGIDLMLLTGTMETARLCRARIITAVRDGSLPEQRVREAAARVLQLRERRAGPVDRDEG
jgi:beta-N-acetylhexosaminidase